MKTFASNTCTMVKFILGKHLPSAKGSTNIRIVPFRMLVIFFVSRCRKRSCSQISLRFFLAFHERLYRLPHTKTAYNQCLLVSSFDTGSVQVCIIKLISKIYITNFYSLHQEFIFFLQINTPKISVQLYTQKVIIYDPLDRFDQIIISKRFTSN